MRTFAQSPDDGNGTGGGNLPPGVTDITPGQTQTQDPNSPLNQRFSELTGTIKEQREAAARQEAVIAQLMATQAQMQAQFNQRPPVEPSVPSYQLALPEGTDPALAAVFQQQTAMFQKMLADQNAQTQKMVAQTTGQIQAQTQNMQLQQALVGQTPEVAREAQRLYALWNQNGYSGWSPQDAVIYARGSVGAGPAPQRRGIPDQTVQGGGAGPDPRFVQAGTLDAPLPDSEIQKMTLNQEVEYWRKRLEKQGGVDQPLRVF